MSPGVAVLSWAQAHRFRALCLVILAGLVFCVASAALSPGEADAVAPIVIVAGVVAALSGASLVGGAVDGSVAALNDWVCGGMRTGINWLLSFIMSTGNDLSSAATVMARFDQLISGAYPIIAPIHSYLITGAAQVVLAACLVIGLAKVLQRAGQNEAGIDAWQLMLVFIMYTVASILATESLDLMELVYNIVYAVSQGANIAASQAGAFTWDGLSEDFNDFGSLLELFLVTVLLYAVVGAVYVISNAVVLIRALQLYLYTALAPVSLGFLVSESTRSMATGFMKRYLAVCLSFLVMTVLFAMAGAVISSVGTTLTAPDLANPTTLIQFQTDLITLVMVMVAFAFAVFKSGAWSKELLGM